MYELHICVLIMTLHMTWVVGTGAIIRYTMDGKGLITRVEIIKYIHEWVYHVEIETFQNYIY